MTDKVVIANGASLSSAVGLGGRRVAGIVMPGTWTAANLTFQVSHDNGVTFKNVYDEAGAEYSVTAAPVDGYIALDAGALELSAGDSVKVRSGTAGTPVNQGAAREIYLVLV